MDSGFVVRLGHTLPYGAILQNQARGTWMEAPVYGLGQFVGRGA